MCQAVIWRRPYNINPADAGRNGGVSLMNPACRVSRRAVLAGWAATASGMADAPLPAEQGRRGAAGLACLCLCG